MSTATSAPTKPAEPVYYNEPTIQAAVKELVAQNKAEAFTVLGLFYEYCDAFIGMKTYRQLAEEFYEKAAKLNEPFAIARLKKDEKKGKKLLSCLEPAKDIEESARSSFKDWISNDENRRNDLVKYVYAKGFDLGLINGLGSSEHTEVYIKEAAKRGFAPAIVEAEDDPEKIKPLAEGGYDFAQMIYSTEFLSKDVEANKHKLSKYVETLAKNCALIAKVISAMMILKDGGGKPSEEALKLLNEAAEAGHVYAADILRSL